MLRRILGTIAAIVVFGVVTTLVQMIGHAIWPFPEGVNPRDAAAIAAIVDSIPLAAKAWVLLAYFIAAIAGGIAGLRIALWTPAVWIMVACAWLGSAINITLIPHPLWMAAGSFIAPLLGGWIATILSPVRD